MSVIERQLFDQVMVPNYAPLQNIPVKGQGSRLWDQQGREYIDFAGGIAVNCLGHNHPELVKALTEQANKVWHLSNIWTNEPALQLAKALTDATFADKVFFANSGAEANEAALKLARRYAQDHFSTEKDQIIAFKNGFHGRTFFTVTAGGTQAYSEGFGPKPGGITHSAYDDIAELKALISDKTCAVILEPMQGEGGVVSPETEFLKQVRDLCDKHHALLIFDEVQTGMGRTGKLFAYMGQGVVPDILTSAKSLGGGFPISAMLTTDNIAQSLKVGTHGSTYGGNPLACAVALKVLELVNTPELLDGVIAKQTLLMDGLKAIGDKFSLFKQVRGQGLLIGVELNSEYQGRAFELLKVAETCGVLVLVAGADVVRFTPALNISEAEIEQGLTCFEKAVAEFLSSKG